MSKTIKKTKGWLMRGKKILEIEVEAVEEPADQGDK